MTAPDDKPPPHRAAIDNKTNPSRKEIRAQQQAKALRENLHRRKEQTRARSTAGKDDPEPS